MSGSHRLRLRDLLVLAAALGVLGACARSRTERPVGATAPDSNQVRGRYADSGSLGSFERPSADARSVRGLGFEQTAERERFLVFLGDSAGSASRSPGAAHVEWIRPLGIVRVHLDRRVASTAIADTTFQGRLAGRAFVVRSLEQRALFVDLHVRAPALARAEVFADPGRVVVELEPGGSALPPPAAMAQRTIVLIPRGVVQPYPLAVWGYARNFEANVVAELRQNGQMAKREVTTAADWLETWGEFRMRFTDGPTDSVQLFVGDYSAKDGSEEGVKLPLEMR